MHIKSTLLVLSLISLVLFGCQPQENQTKANKTKESQIKANQIKENQTKEKKEVTGQSLSTYQGTDWTLNNLAGEPITLSDYQGKPTLLIFWATWCPYCKKLLPGIAELNDKYEGQGLKILAVNIREDWKPEVYWRNFGYKFDTVLEGDEVAKIYGVKGTPGIVFISPSGKVLGVQSFSDPHHPLLEKFAKEGLALMKD